MRSRVTFLHHPVHPILVTFPVVLLPILVILDAVSVAEPALDLWTAGFLLAAIGGVTAAVAAIPGIVDLAAIPNEGKAHRTAVNHLILGLFIIGLYIVTTYLRWPIGTTPANPVWILGIDAVGTIAVFVQGWLGGQLVYKHHVGVDAPAEGAEPTQLNAGPGLHVPPPRDTKRRRVL